MEYDPFCSSSYLAFRYVVEQARAWKPGLVPEFPHIVQSESTTVNNAKEILSFLRENLARFSKENTGLLLSGGIDSAILAALLPRGTRFYTIRFSAEGAIDETLAAQSFAQACGSSVQVVDVGWDDYLKYCDLLIKRKKSPLHAIEPGLYVAGLAAKNDGLDTLIVGNGADSTFGGMDKLLSKDWTLEEFINRYTFVDPMLVLKNAVSMRGVFKRYVSPGDSIDVQRFLKVSHGIGIIQTFENAINASGSDVVAPYEDLLLGTPLDIQRIRNGEPKYLLREVFNELYPGVDVPPKAPFPRPMEDWMADWTGPTRREFLDELDIKQFSGEQKWLIYCLERFMEIFDSDHSNC